MGGDDCKVYVGNLPDDVRRRDLEDVFYKYGKIADIDIHTTRGGGAPFAFVLFDDDRDADDAIRGRNGYEFDGYRLRVERCRGGRDRSPPRMGGSSYYRGGRGGGGDRGDRGDRGGDRGDRGGGRGGRFPNIPRRSDYRVKVGGLPPTGSWQDIKDHLREAGDVYYAEVYGDGTGIVEFARQKDSEYACKNLDNTKFKSHEGETTYITVTEDTSGGSRRSRSRSGGSRRSRSRSPRRSYSRSPAKRGRSYSKSRSRSPYN